MQHCLAAFVAGTICAFVQVAMSAWLGRGHFIGAATLIAVMLSFLPPFYAYVFLMGPDKCVECELNVSVQDLQRLSASCFVV